MSTIFGFGLKLVSLQGVKFYALPRNHHFSFKQFTVHQELSAMKVCTDACVFGAWADVEGAERVLDIGTGTGLLSMMVAQRIPLAKVDGVEVDPDAYRQTVLNFNSSPFADRLTVFHMRVQDFSPAGLYDCIISNPPFFQNDLRSPDQKINLAHHAESLNFSDLLRSAERLIAPGGFFHVLLPVAESAAFEQLATSGIWILERELLLVHRPGAEPFRRMITLRCLQVGESRETNADRAILYIYGEAGTGYDPLFKEYLKEFYLAF